MTEYKVVHVGITGSSERHATNIEEACNVEARAGWRLVDVVFNPTSPRFFLFFEQEDNASA